MTTTGRVYFNPPFPDPGVYIYIFLAEDEDSYAPSLCPPCITFKKVVGGLDN